jgi:hypothetical protein
VCTQRIFRPIIANLCATPWFKVDGLVAYFNGLYDEDQAVIQQLEGEVAAKIQIINTLSCQGQGLQKEQHPHQQQAAVPQTGVGLRISGMQAPLLRAEERRPLEGHGMGCCAALKSSCVARPRTWLCCAAATVALLALVVGLAAGLAGHAAPRSIPPQFVYAPVALAAGSSSLNLQLALDRAGTLHYVVMPAGQQQRASGDAGSVVGASYGLLGGSALEVRFQARALHHVLGAGVQGRRGTAGACSHILHDRTPATLTLFSLGAFLQQVAVACGQLPVHLANTNLTLTIASQADTPECLQLKGLAASTGAEVSCNRCPALQSSTVYSVLLVPTSGSAAGNVVRIEVSHVAVSKVLGIWSRPSALSGSFRSRTFATPIHTYSLSLACQSYAH